VVIGASGDLSANPHRDELVNAALNMLKSISSRGGRDRS